MRITTLKPLRVGPLLRWLFSCLHFYIPSSALISVLIHPVERNLPDGFNSSVENALRAEYARYGMGSHGWDLADY